MVSDRDKKKADQKKAALAAKFSLAAGAIPKTASTASLAKSESALSLLNVKKEEDFSARTVTGVLSSRPTSRDIKIDGFSMGLNGAELIQDCTIELTIGRRYGLLGSNGCGKTNFLECLAKREVPIPMHMDLYHLKEEAEPSDRTALEAVVDHIKEEMARLNAEEERIMQDFGPEDERLQAIYERLDELDPTMFEASASKLLHGLGFTKMMMERQTKSTAGAGAACNAAQTLGWNTWGGREMLDMRSHMLHSQACVACTYANLVKQAKSKQKILDKMEADGLTKPVARERNFQFTFPDTEKLPPPVLPFQDVSFSYNGPSHPQLESLSSLDPQQQTQAAASAAAAADFSSASPQCESSSPPSPAPQTGPQTGEQWVECLVQQMSTSSDMADARGKAALILQQFEGFVCSRVKEEVRRCSRPLSAWRAGIVRQSATSQQRQAGIGMRVEGHDRRRERVVDHAVLAQGHTPSGSVGPRTRTTNARACSFPASGAPSTLPTPTPHNAVVQLPSKPFTTVSLRVLLGQDKAAAAKAGALQKENLILKRAVQIQNSKLQERAATEAEMLQLRHMTAAFQEQVKQLELSNYSLALHLQKATTSSYGSTQHRNPDVF
ncbi:MAG: hypothetical protein WDW38_008066 [Sanguina aurantia]